MGLKEYLNKRKQMRQIKRDIKKRKVFTLSEFVLPRGMVRFDSEGNQISEKDSLFTDYFFGALEVGRSLHVSGDVEKQYQRKSPEDILKDFNDRYSSKSKELLRCPFCGCMPHIMFDLRKYTQTEGYPGGFDIKARVICSSCLCTFGNENRPIYSNITFKPDEYTLDSVDEDIDFLINKWNKRIGE